MADALLSPAVGGAMWTVSSGLAAYSARKVQKISTKKKYLLWVCLAHLFLQRK
jgi:cobalt/nickel transport system permease protein